MKIKIVLLSIILIFIGVYGWRFFYGAFNNYNKLKDTKQEIETVKYEVSTTLGEINSSTESIQSKYKIATADSLYDFTTAFLQETSASFTKVIGKRFVNNTATTVATYSSVDDLHSLTQVDTLEVIVTVNDSIEFLEKLENSNYFINKLTIYPTDNCISVEFFVLGGVTE